MVSKRYRDIVSTMREKWIHKQEVPVCFSDDVWDQWVAWWNSPEFLKISERNKRNRSSKGGKDCLHMGGSVSVVDLLDRMQKVYGMHIDIADVFAAMHTKKNDAGELIWVSDEAQKIFEYYIEIVHEKAVTEGIIIDHVDSPVTHHPFDPDAWKDAVTKYYISEGKRIKRGDRLFGLGEHGAALINLSSNTGRSSRSSSPPPLSSNPEKEELKTEVSNLKEILMQLKQQLEEYEQRQQQEEQRRQQEDQLRRQQEDQQRQQMFQQFVQQMMGSGIFQQQRQLGINSLMGGGMFQQQQLQPPQQLLSQQQQQQHSSGNDFLGYLQLLAGDGSVFMGGGNVGCVGVGGSDEGGNGSQNGSRNGSQNGRGV